MPTISFVVAMDQQRVIGNHGQLPWSMPADLQHFKKITMGKPIIMGRKTYESIGRPLPGRHNIVLTQNKNLLIDGCTVVNTLGDAINAATEHDEVMVIGGAQIFADFMPLVSKMYLTLIKHDFDGDTLFPAWDQNDWQEVDRIEHQPDPKNPYPYTFITLVKK